MKLLSKNGELRVAVITEDRRELIRLLNSPRMLIYRKYTDGKIWYSLKKAVFYVKFEFEYPSERQNFKTSYQALHSLKSYKKFKNRDRLRGLSYRLSLKERQQLDRAYREENRMNMYQLARYYARMELIDDLL